MKLYVVVSKTLSKSQQFVQGTHAAIEWALSTDSSDHHPVLVMLTCPKDIKDFQAELLETNKNFYEFRDSYFNHELTSIASTEIGDLVKDFDLI